MRNSWKSSPPWMCLAVVAVALTTVPAPAVPIAPGQGVSFAQIDWTFPGAEFFDSPYGQFAADFDQLAAHTGLTAGYLNVFTAQGWVVRNMPVFEDWSYPGLSTQFALGSLSVGDITALPVAVEFTAEPLLDFEAIPTLTFPVGAVENNAQGRNGPRLLPPLTGLDVSPVVFDPLGALIRWLQNGHPSVEQDENQCGPASVANSLQWLENEFGIDVPHDPIPGIDGTPPKSLVGQLDQGMGRNPGETVSDEAAITGKLRYIDDNALGDDLVVKHWGGTFVAGDRTVGGVTSDDQTDDGLSLIEWIQREVKDGEDVELALGFEGSGGHWVDVTAAGSILGVPWVAWVHDAKQGKPGGTGLFDGGIVWTPVVDGKAVLFDNATLDLALSESPKEPNCDSGPTALCLNDDRFRITVEWATDQGATGDGQGVPLTDDSAYFWFFNQDNIELVVKVLNACSFADHFWVFACGLTDVEIDIIVEDTLSGAVRTYHNPQKQPFQAIQDTSAFATCP